MRDIDNMLKSTLTDLGFVLKNTSWYRLTYDFIHVLNFQKSQFSNKYYLNIGIDYNINHITSFPSKFRFLPEYKFPVRLRAEAFSFSQNLLDAFDYDNNYTESQRFTSVVAVVDYCVSFLDSISTMGKFATTLQLPDNPLSKGLITADFKRKLNQMR